MRFSAALVTALGSLLAIGCTSSVASPSADSANSAASEPKEAEPSFGEGPRRVDVSSGSGHASFDDLRYSERLGKVIVAPSGNAKLTLVDPDSLATTTLGGLSTSTTSADEGHGLVIAADPEEHAIVTIDPKTNTIAGRAKVSGSADYVRWSESTSEIWVTEPSLRGIEVFALPAGQTTPALVGFVDVGGGPEGVVFDAKRGRAYAHTFDGHLVAIDLGSRSVVAKWTFGCSGAHGIPALDEARGFVFTGCRDGQIVALDVEHDGREVGRHALPDGGEAILGFSAKLGHAYLRGDPGTTVAVLGVSSSGALTLLGTKKASPSGHGLAADDRGNVWVCDANKGALLAFRDDFDPTL